MHDCLVECNNLGVSEDEFHRIWCVRCVQPDCLRSHQGKTRFEARVGTWQERLFTDVPRMPESDPRYPDLASRAFITAESWKSSQVQVPVAVGSWDPPASDEKVAQPDPAPLPSGFVEGRVPHQSGKMVGDQIVLKPGGRIRMGGAAQPSEPSSDSTKDSGGETPAV